jgi:hypothetical protein
MEDEMRDMVMRRDSGEQLSFSSDIREIFLSG